MMKRKVIQLAGKTLVVSLPSKWARQQNITKGQEVEVTCDINGLHITPDSRPQWKKHTLDVRPHDDATIKSALSVLHKAGADEIEVFYHPEQQKTIHERVRTNLMGFEVVQQSPQRMLIQNVTGDADQSFDALMRRVFLVTLELATGVEHALHTQTSAAEFLSLEETNNKLTNYCHRLLIKKQAEHSIFTYTILWLQEKIADDYKTIIHLMENKQSSHSAQKSATHLTSALRAYYEAVYSPDLSTISRARKHIESIDISVKDDITAAFCSVKQHLLDGIGSLTALALSQAPA
ncbi:AbrB/MazE/SpoVT family DNA-binding domain-containing protein [Candidatus Woesearchaeota archaeon]|nr:AbrB/MazE/SpoVT family DNA-binding domain-containing protein [Candidatus Woesearchaeota archaeon]